MEMPRQVTVVVEGKDYVCDFQKLSELSDYFRRLFESDFKERRSNRVVLENITIEVFNVIFSYINRQEIGDESMITEYLQSLRKDAEGDDNDVSSEERIVNVLLSFDFLLIEPLVTICENFIKEIISEENFERFIDEFEKMPDPTRLMCFCFLRFSNLMSMTIREKLLCFSAEQLCLLVNDPSLNRYSKDILVDSILEWVGCHKRQVESGKRCNAEKPSEDKQKEERQVGSCWNIHLPKLFKAAQIFLVSRNHLKDLIENDLVKGCPEAKDVVLNAIFYHENISFRYKWSSDAVHRACSNNKRAVVYIDNNQVKLYCLDENDEYIHVICDTSELQNSNGNEGQVFAVFENSLYLGIIEKFPDYPTYKYLNVYRLTEAKQWDLIGKFRYIPHPHVDKKNMWIPQGNHLYLLSNDFCPDSSLAPELSWIDGNIPVFDHQLSSIVPLLDTILFIFRRTRNVISFDPVRETSTDMGYLSGSPSTSISFYYQKDMFILQEDGALWSVHMGNINTKEDIFRRETILWEGGRTLHGAVCFKKELLIFGSAGTNHLGAEDSTKLMVNCLPDFNIEKVRMINISSDSQCFPMLVPKSWTHDNLHLQ